MTRRNTIGLVPAAGQASRIAPLPCSKELYPVGFRAVDGGQSVRAKVACHYLLEKMRVAGITKVYIVLRSGKWDIPAYFGDGTMVGGPSGSDMHLAYLMMRLPFGAPYTIDQAYPFVQDARVVFGFPDILFQPDNAFAQLLDHQAATNADVVLGLFPSDQPYKMDMVDLDEDGRVRRIVIKPRQTHLRYTWIIAVWTPVFTQFMHEYLATLLSDISTNEVQERELYIGHVIQAAIDSKVQVEAVLFAEGAYLDIGTPDDLVRAVRNGGNLL